MDEKKAKYRHEFKYPVSDGEIALLTSRMKYLLRPDPHVGDSGIYNISSLYFDDYYNTCYYDNLTGTDPREKFRIRIYNHQTDRISLECKRKERGKTLKTSCILTREQAEILVHGGVIGDIASQPQLIKKFTMQQLTHHLRPRMIVEYERIPYVCSEGNVRITIDKNLCSSLETGNFLTGACTKRPVMPVGMHLLEVKYDEFLPDEIYRALQLDSLTQTAYSKYFLCMNYAVR